MATNLTNFYERGTDVADIYIGKDEIQDLVLSNNFDLNKLSDVGFQEISCNTIWGWGWNLNRVLGQATGEGIFDSKQYSSPIFVTDTNSDWCFISAACAHSSALKTDGSLWTWGSNSTGSFGDGTAISNRTPVQELTTSIWTQVSAGPGFTSAIKSDGTIWSWGNNTCGVLGINDNTVTSVSSPVQEVTNSAWIAISSGRTHTVAIKNNSTLWGWGAGCQLGSNTILNVSSPVQESSLSNWSKISAGYGNTLAIKTDGTMWGVGRNPYGELGNGTTVGTSSFVNEASGSSDWCAVSTSSFSSHGIKTNGTLWSWGINDRGALGDGTTLDKCSPVQEVTLSTNWNKLASGGVNSRHVAAIKNDGTLWSWGSNDAGTLGNGVGTYSSDRSSPVQEVRNLDTWTQASRGFCFTIALKR